MGGFDMGISFYGFEENMKKFMELPVKYLDSAHDKAVEFMEDVHAILYAPFNNDVVPHTEDKSSHHVITESSPTSVGTEVVGPNVEASTPPASLITVENSSNGCVDTDAHQTEPFSSKHTDSSEEVILWNPETSIKPQRPHDLATIPQDDHEPHALETDKVIEQVGLQCSGHSDSSVYCGVIPLGNSSADYEEQLLSHANDPVGVTVQDSTAISQDDCVPQALPKEQVTEQDGLNCSVHSGKLPKPQRIGNSQRCASVSPAGLALACNTLDSSGKVLVRVGDGRPVSIGKGTSLVCRSKSTDCSKELIYRKWRSDVELGDLPEDVLRKVFSKLHFNEAVRTSVLSRK